MLTTQWLTFWTVKLFSYHSCCMFLPSFSSSYICSYENLLFIPGFWAFSLLLYSVGENHPVFYFFKYLITFIVHNEIWSCLFQVSTYLPQCDPISILGESFFFELVANIGLVGHSYIFIKICHQGILLSFYEGRLVLISLWLWISLLLFFHLYLGRFIWFL